MSAEQAAVGVAEIVDENMANAARVHAVERGVAIAERTLVAFGGAAPLHASRLAEKLGIERIIVPPDAGVGSAVGFLAAPAAYEIVRSRYMRLEHLRCGGRQRADRRHAAGGASRIAGPRPAAAGSVQRLGLHALCRPGPRDHGRAARPQARRAADAASFRADFEREYTRLFARHIPNAEIEIMSWLVLATTATEPPQARCRGRRASRRRRPSASARSSTPARPPRCPCRCSSATA